MPGYIRAFLNDNRVKLGQEIEFTSPVKDQMYQEGVITKDNMDCVCRPNSTMKECVANFIDYMARREYKTWETFLLVLENMGEPCHMTLRELWDQYDPRDHIHGQRFLESHANDHATFLSEVPPKWHYLQNIDTPPPLPAARPTTLDMEPPPPSYKDVMYREKQMKERKAAKERAAREERARREREAAKERKRQEEIQKARKKREHHQQLLNDIRVRPSRIDSPGSLFTNFHRLQELLPSREAITHLISTNVLSMPEYYDLKEESDRHRSAALLALLDKKARAKGIPEKQMLLDVADVVVEHCEWVLDCV